MRDLEGPEVYDVKDVVSMLPQKQPIERVFSELVKALQSLIGVSRDVVHGRGLVAKTVLFKGEIIVDPTSVYYPGAPKSKENGETFVKTSDGFFKIHSFVNETPKRLAFAYLCNEARERRPNVAYCRSHDGLRPVLGLKVLTPLVPGDELLCVYDQYDDDEDIPLYDPPPSPLSPPPKIHRADMIFEPPLKRRR